jgi:hypothetical protein
VARTGTKKNRVWKVRKGTIPLFMVGNRIMRQVHYNGNSSVITVSFDKVEVLVDYL